MYSNLELIEKLMKKILRVEGIVFDIGDTLIGATNIAKKSLEETAEFLLSKDIINNKSDFVRNYIMVDKTIQGPKINHLFSDVLIIEQALKKSGADYSLQIIEQFLANYRDNVRNRITKNTSLIKLFSKLKSLSFKLGVVTDGSTVEQTEQLHRLGILDKITSCVTSEFLNLEKPNKIMFEKSLEELDISEPSRAVMVGNDLVRDIKGAKNAGMKTILVTKFIPYQDIQTKPEPDIVINSVYELPTCLEYVKDGLQK